MRNPSVSVGAVAPQRLGLSPRLQRLLLGAGLTLALLAPALWNGFPLIFPDTGGYFARPIEGTLLMGRSALYGLFLYLTAPGQFWPAVLAQCAAMAWIVMLMLRVHGLADRPRTVAAIIALLALGSSLPWLAAQLMPDILFPAAALALLLLVFHDEALGRGERLALAAVGALAGAGHMAALGLCIGLLVLLAIAPRVIALPRPRLGLAGFACVAGVALCLLSNAAIGGAFRFTPGGASFLFGRLVEDGIVARYLRDVCPNPRLRVCDYRADIPDGADAWLWENDTPFYKLGGAEGFDAEARRIIADSLRRYPAAHVTAALAAVGAQLTHFATEVSTDDNAPALDTLSRYRPSLTAPLAQARQQQDDAIDVRLLNAVHVPLGALAMLALVPLLVFRRRLGLPADVNALVVTVLLALIVNAAICGVFSHAVDRYQSRLVPLALIAVAIAASRAAPRLEAPPG